MTTLLRNRLSWLFLCLLAASAAYGQTSELNLTLGEQRVRFAPTRSFQEMRLEIVNSVGEVVFTHTTTEAEFDWNLRTSNGDALTPGLYRYAVTLKFTEELSRQHRGNLIIERDQQQVWLTAQDGAEISGTALNAARSSGRSVAGFRTAEDKSVKREVSGREVVDTKGNKLTENQKAVKREKAALLGTQNKVAKFDVGGVNLIDSAMTDIGHVIINSDTNLQAAGLGSLIIEGQSNKERVELRSAGAVPGPALQGKGFGGTIAAPSATVANTDLFIIGGSGHNSTGLVTLNAGTVRIKAEQTWTPTANGAYINFETTPSGSPTTSRAERMRITGDGNVGIGNPAPGAKLDVAGDIRSTALRQELTAHTPNIINGFIGTGSGGATPGNRVTPGVIGATIGGGGFNGTLNFPSGGIFLGDRSNVVTDWFGIVGGGFANRAGNADATLDNASFATVGGGNGNVASGDRATVGGGGGNTASGTSATVGGGRDNIAGQTNPNATVNGNYATVAGGNINHASGDYATVAGGGGNTASGNYSFAAGRQAFAQHEGAFVWADSTNVNFGSSAANQFLIRASGGVGIGTNTPGNLLTVNGNASFGGVAASVGEPVEVQGSAAGVSYYDRTTGAVGRWVTYANGDNFNIWKGSDKVTILPNGNLCAANINCLSDARLKTQITGLRYGLSQLMRLRPVSWKWKDGATTQLPLGLIAQEVAPVMPELVLHPTEASGSLGLNYMGLLPVMVKATQEQQAQIQQQQAQIQQLLQANQRLQQRLAKVERRVKTSRP